MTQVETILAQIRTILAQIAKLDQTEREKLLVALCPEVLSFSGASGSGQSRSFSLGQSQSFSPADFPLIVQTPGVCGGAARLIRTRIPVWVLERMRQLGVSAEEILRSYPTLQRADLLQAWSYAACHREQIEKDIQENEEE